MWLPCKISVKTHLKQGLVYRCVFILSCFGFIAKISATQSITIIATSAIIVDTNICIIAINTLSNAISITSNLMNTHKLKATTSAYSHFL